jgi:hypothetical protein
MLACVNCAHPISLDPKAGGLPPWGPNCGASLKLSEPKPAALETAAQASTLTSQSVKTVARQVETAVSTYDRISPSVEKPRRSKLLRNGALLCLLASAGSAYFTETETSPSAQANAWFWSLAMAGIGCTMLVFWARLRFR